MYAAPATLPRKDTDKGWLVNQNTSPGEDKLYEFCDLFSEQLLDNRNLAIDTWHCGNARHRKNNSMENWNNKLKVSVTTIEFVQTPQPGET